jgi:quinol-cytochrome oxidoreductase complex cytochrome b subunit
MASSSSPASERSWAARLWEFCDERLGLTPLIELVRHKQVPQHAHAVWYYLGGIALFFFGVQIVTGVLLLVYFRPGPEAFNSVRRITYDVEFGWLIRSAHSWSANLMVLAVFLHLFSVALMKAYRRPREFGWWTGLALLGLTMTFGFSGYLLPMDELAYFATKVGLEIPSSVPLVGPFMADLIRGGPTVDENTIQRFFTLHVVLLPALFALLLGVHLYLVQRHGNAVPPREEAKPAAERHSIKFFPDFMVKDLTVWLVALNVLGFLACLWPWQLGTQADPVSAAPAGIHPEWYFMAPFQLLKVLGVWLPGSVGELAGIFITTVGGFLLVLLPLLDRSQGNQRTTRFGTWFTAACIVGLVGLTAWGYLAL